MRMNLMLFARLRRLHTQLGFVVISCLAEYDLESDARRERLGMLQLANTPLGRQPRITG